MMKMTWDSDMSNFFCHECGGSCEPGLDNRWRCTNCGRAESTDSAAARRQHSGAELAGTGTSAGSGGDSIGPTDPDGGLPVSPLGGHVRHGPVEGPVEGSAAASDSPYESADIESERAEAQRARLRVARQQVVLQGLYYAVELVDRGASGWHRDQVVLEALIYLVQNTPPINPAGIRMT